MQLSHSHSHHHDNQQQRDWRWWLLALFTILTPLLVNSVLMQYFFDATLLEIVPFWNDEISHWHQSATFAEAGFNGGHYTLDENVPVADWSHYYSWGVFPYMIYGTLARLFGWQLASLALWNLFFFTLSTGLFIFRARLSRDMLLGLAALLATFVPLLTYLPSSMLQLLYLAIATVLALGGVLALRGDLTGWQRVLVLAFAWCAGLLRPTFAVMILPLWIVSLQEKTLPRILRAVVLSIPLIGAAAYLYSITASPFPYFRTEIMSNLTQPGDLWRAFIDYMQWSAQHLVQGPAMILGQRIQIIGLAALVGVWGIRQWSIEPKSTTWRWELGLHLFNLVGFFAATIILHEALDGHDYRVMAPHLFFSLLLLVGRRRWGLLGVMVVSSLLLMPSAMENYRQKAPNFAHWIVPAQLERWNPVVDDVIRYDADAPSPWCNTVAVSFYYLLPGQGDPGLALSIDPGIGITWLHNMPGSDRFVVPQQLRSRYVMLTTEDAQRWSDRFDGEPRAAVQNGTLYVNRNTPCD